MSYEEELLGHDVIIEILLWLPPESLLKFKRVCRSWYSTIRDAKFMAKYKSNFSNLLQDNNVRLVIATQKSSRTSFSLQLRLFDESNPEIVHEDMELAFPNSNYSITCYGIKGSCNGLFCCATNWVDDAPILLCNPSIRWAYLIRPYRFIHNNRTVNSRYGVGFDQFANDYKVLKLVYGHSETAIYSVKTKSWKIINVEFPPKRLWCFSLSIFLRGFIHWLAYTVQGWKRTILLFDVCNEVLGEMQLPEMDKWYDTNPSSISVVKGSLCLLVEELRDDEGICHVWTMNEYGVSESWTKQLRVVHGKISMRSLKLTVGGKIVFCSYDNSSKLEKLVLYDPETDEYKNVCQFQAGSSMCSLVASVQLLDGAY